MCYPSNFVLVTAETEAELLRQHGSMVAPSTLDQSQTQCPNTRCVNVTNRSICCNGRHSNLYVVVMMASLLSF